MRRLSLVILVALLAARRYDVEETLCGTNCPDVIETYEIRDNGHRYGSGFPLGSSATERTYWRRLRKSQFVGRGGRVAVFRRKPCRFPEHAQFFGWHPSRFERLIAAV